MYYDHFMNLHSKIACYFRTSLAIQPNLQILGQFL